MCLFVVFSLWLTDAGGTVEMEFAPGPRQPPCPLVQVTPLHPQRSSRIAHRQGSDVEPIVGAEAKSGHLTGSSGSYMSLRQWRHGQAHPASITERHCTPRTRRYNVFPDFGPELLSFCAADPTSSSRVERRRERRQRPFPVGVAAIEHAMPPNSAPKGLVRCDATSSLPSTGRGCPPQKRRDPPLTARLGIRASSAATPCAESGATRRIASPARSEC